MSVQTFAASAVNLWCVYSFRHSTVSVPKGCKALL